MPILGMFKSDEADGRTHRREMRPSRVDERANRRGLKETDPDGTGAAYLAAAARARTRFWLSEAFSRTRL
jgi:hypothetical protein